MVYMFPSLYKRGITPQQRFWCNCI